MLPLFIFSILNMTAVNSTAYADNDLSPQLFITPAPVFDLICQQSDFKIDPILQKKLRLELNTKIDEFRKSWSNQAAALISESERAAGRKFIRKEYSVALTLCGWIPMGDPTFIVSALPYLGEPRKFRGIDLPLSMEAFVSMTHHELLHSLVDNIENNEFSNASSLIKKYQSEPFNVLIHLHLMAIQKSTYERLKNHDLLKATETLYGFIGGDYQRAWQIVGSEGTESFLAELQLFNSKHK